MAVADNDFIAPIIPPRATVTMEMGDLGGKYFGKAPDPQKTRHYYIAAEPVMWDFAPAGEDLVCGKILPQEFQAHRTAAKMRYVQYEDADFTRRVLPEERLGILGPVLRGVTGEYLEVTFLNRCRQPLSMHPHGVKYDKDSEGAYYKPSPGLGAAVAPGAKFTYVWYCDETASPLPGEPSSKAWLYHSHAGSDTEINLGLLGFIIVTDASRARPDGSPNDVDREMAAAFMIFNESNSAAPISAPTGSSDPDAGQRYTINGLAYGNLKGLDLNEDERVRWYLFGLGSESDLHTPHWHGLRVTDMGRHTDTVELLPASMKVVDMLADNPGTWLFHCHVAEHMDGGMFAAVRVYAANTQPVSREPAPLFFGLPEEMRDLRLEPAALSLGGTAAEIDLAGAVAVPENYAIEGQPITIAIGKKSLTLKPDQTGLCRAPEGTLLIKNSDSLGLVRGGALEFDLTLRGSGWVDELSREGTLVNKVPAKGGQLKLDLQVGNVPHSISTALIFSKP